MMRVRVKIWLEKEGKPVLGNGKLTLLQAIDEEGSISRAALKLGISFRRAWNFLDSVERNIGLKLLKRKKGGTGGGSTRLTEEAKELIARFNRLSEETRRYAESRFRSLFEEVDENDLGGRSPGQHF